MVDQKHTYFLAGDISPDILRRASMMIVNTDLLTDIGEDVNTIYASILNGSWTYEELHTLVGKVYIDENGDTIRDDGDSYGFAMSTRSDVDHLVLASGLKACSYDADGVPYIDFNNERTINLVETLVNLIWNNTGTYYKEGAPLAQMLTESRVLFLCGKFAHLDTYREVETNFSVIPVPKYDETVDHYSSLVHDVAAVLCIPSISMDTKNTTAVIESLACEYYHNVMPAYYDIVLKTKYQRDQSDTASMIMDMIHEGVCTDFTYFYNYALGAMLTSLRELIGVKKSTDFLSSFKSNEKSYLTSMENLIKAISEKTE